MAPKNNFSLQRTVKQRDRVHGEIGRASCRERV